MNALAWFDGLDEATQLVALEDDVVHRVTWRRGKLVLEDHDVEAEQALVALGGTRCHCLAIADLFAAPPELHEIVQTSSPRRLSPSPRRPPTGLPPGLRGAAAHIPPSALAQMKAEHEAMLQRSHRLGVLRTIDGDLRRRLLASASVAASRRGIGGYPDDWIGLNRFYSDEIAPAVEWSLRGARRNLPPGAKVDFHLRLLSNGNASIEGVVSRAGGSVHLTVQARWLADVWAHDLTIVDDHPIVDVRERPTVDSAWVTAIAWSRTRFELTEPRLETLFIARDELGFWRSATDRRAR